MSDRPAHDQDLSAIIKAFVRRPFSAEIMGTRIAWLWDHIEPPSGNCYTAMPSDKQAVYGFLKEIFGLFPANPSKQNRRDVFNALYQKSAFGTDVYERLSDRLNDYIREGKRAIAIIGQRGAGKTSFLNMWLHENTHHFLEQEQKILWFRVDASKLYNFRHSDVQSYFKVHAAYVIVVYATGIDPEASINPTFRDIMLKSGLDKKIGGISKSLGYNEQSLVNLIEQKKQYEDIYKEAQAKIDALLNVAKLSKSDTNSNTIKSSFQSMSEEQANVLTAQFSSIRIHMSDLLDTTNDYVNKFELLAQDVTEIKKYAAMLEDIKSSIKDMQTRGIKVL